MHASTCTDDRAVQDERLRSVSASAGAGSNPAPCTPFLSTLRVCWVGLRWCALSLFFSGWYEKEFVFGMKECFLDNGIRFCYNGVRFCFR